jgi:hypothetical protein
MITRPVYEVGQGLSVTGRQFPTGTYINDRLVPGSNVYVEFGWIWDVPTPNPLHLEHAHNYDQIALHIGSDPHHPEDLGGEMDIMVGGENINTNKTHGLYLPKGVRHAPLTWKRVDRPILEMTIILGTGSHEEAKVGGMK